MFIENTLENDEFYLWLIEQEHNSHLEWVVIYLTGLFSEINILIQLQKLKFNLLVSNNQLYHFQFFQIKTLIHCKIFYRKVIDFLNNRKKA